MSGKKKWPQHQDPGPGRRGKAPYNFVALPEAILPGTSFEKHDRLCPDRHHGVIELRIVTETPTYTRCAYPPEEEGKNTRESPHRQEFYHHGDPHAPVIPGSTQRGLVRSLVEIMSYSRLTRRPSKGGAVRVRDECLVFRAVADDRSPSGAEYAGRFLGRRAHQEFDYPHADVRAGYLESDGRGGWQIRPAQVLPSGGRTFSSVTEAVLTSAGVAPLPPKKGNGRDGISCTLRDLWFRPAPFKGHRSKNVTLWHCRVHHVATSHAPGLVQGKLVYTGPIPTRHMHSIVHPADPSAPPLPIPEDVWAAYEEDRDLQRGIMARKVDGPGQPVFYLVGAHGDVVFLGPCPFFRIPYANYTVDFVPEATLGGEEAPLDLAESIFGTVNGDRAIRGRVSFDDAVMIEAPVKGPAYEQSGACRVAFRERFSPWVTSSGLPDPVPSFDAEIGYRVELLLEGHRAEDRGSGPQQWLLVAGILAVGGAGVVGVEEPEAHLSPETQERIFLTLTRTVEGAGVPHQLFVSTHSHLALEMNSEGVWYHVRKEAGVTRVERMEGDEGRQRLQARFGPGALEAGETYRLGREGLIKLPPWALEHLGAAVGDRLFVERGAPGELVVMTAQAQDRRLEQGRRGER